MLSIRQKLPEWKQRAWLELAPRGRCVVAWTRAAAEEGNTLGILRREPVGFADCLDVGF